MRLSVPALLLAPLLTGCAVPPAVTVVSLVADGVSYAATGKSTTDHAISAVAGQDCALLRAAQSKNICDPDGEVLVEFEGATTSPELLADHGDFNSRDDGTETIWGSAKPVETVAAPL
ncbi:MAG: hypothetical protein GKS02_00850 [Alphaproteobacteria bacterium]|nr:hypothetical protein [Alphaproteobacteria bacterium]